MHPNSKVNRITQTARQEEQRQGVTEELGTIAGVNSLRGLTARYHCGCRLNVWYLCFEPLRAMIHCVVTLRGTTAGVGSMCGISALSHCGR